MPKKVLYPKNFNTKKPKTLFSRYCIVWRDAYSDQENWSSDDIYSMNDYIVETVGYLIPNDNENYYTLASTVSRDGNYCCIMNIPVNMVISKFELHVPTAVALAEVFDQYNLEFTDK